MKTNSIILGILLIFGLTVGGYYLTWQRPTEVKSDTTVAKVGDEKISTSELRNYIDTRSSRLTTGIDNQLLKKYLNELVISKSLALEARRQQLDQAPAIKLEIEKLLAAELFRKQVVVSVTGRKINQEEIADFYEQHRQQYAKPEQLRLRDIFIAVPQDADERTRKVNRERAEKVLRAAKHASTKRNGFSQLVREYSDKHPLYPLGDTGFFDRQGEPVGLHPALVEAAFSLDAKGVPAEQVITTPFGFHIVMLISRRSAMIRPVEEVAGEIEQRIKRNEIRKKRQQFIKTVTNTYPAVINDKQVKKLTAKYHEAEERNQLNGDKFAAQNSSGENGPPALQDTGKE